MRSARLPGATHESRTGDIRRHPRSVQTSILQSTSGRDPLQDTNTPYVFPK